MKRLSLIAALVTATYISGAQPSINHEKWEDKGSAKPATVSLYNEFAGTEMATNGGIVSFRQLPDLVKPTWAIVTDAKGEVIVQQKVAPSYNSIDIRRLSKGQVYFVSLVYKHKSQKAFVLHR
jgi:hypothetical protein